MASHKLSNQAKTLIVIRLAQFERPSLIQREIKETFGVDVTAPTIAGYDIRHPKFPDKWRELYEKSREDFRKEIDAIPIANKAYRLNQLDRLLGRQVSQPETRQNPVEIRATLEQAAKEAEGHYSNKRELSGPGGKELNTGSNVVVYLPDNGRGDADA